MPIATTVSVLVLALGLEAAFGYPHAIYKRIGHPATWLGALISTFDGALNRAQQSAGLRRAAGVLTLVIIVAIPAGIAWFIERALVSDWAGNLVLAVLASTLLASRSLYVHVRDVAGALETGSIIAARSAVSRIVGRDPQVLDEHGVARAAIESLAENFSDGVVAPAFWLVVARPAGRRGLQGDQHRRQHDRPPHRPPRGVRLGGGAARRSRQPAGVASAALLIRRGGARRQGCVARRRVAGGVARRVAHRSPNAGWPEAAMAGALGWLAGPRVYGGVLVEDAYMGDGRREATPQDIRAALALYRTAVRADRAGRCAGARRHRAKREQPVEVDDACEMRGEPVERALDQFARRRSSPDSAPSRESHARALAVVGEQAVDIGARRPGRRPRRRAVRAAVGEMRERPRAIGPGGHADVHLVAGKAECRRSVVPWHGVQRLFGADSTVSTSSRPSPSTVRGGPSMPSGSAIRLPEHLIAAAEAEHATAAADVGCDVDVPAFGAQTPQIGDRRLRAGQDDEIGVAAAAPARARSDSRSTPGSVAQRIEIVEIGDARQHRHGDCSFASAVPATMR